ncbi:VOC family protein [Demequina oxidasica]|uniref:VOC family protein n=1 Tax=Demequina oxidasica TaxID=676199 RepID=UPI000783377E|nr:VOC family protein [Demequina oxidasica]
MEKVLGIGGLFIRADDPDALAKWYWERLGISLVPQGPTDRPWISEQGPTIFSPFPKDSDYFAENRQFMVNFRVRDLDAMLAQLAAAGHEATHHSAMDGIGKFARVHDPEGNPIELWEAE